MQIDAEGYLKIERAGRMKTQLCPFAGGVGMKCGDWCPHFEEPQIYTIETDLRLCHSKVLSGALDDQRVRK